jgi:hypothetical protein
MLLLITCNNTVCSNSLTNTHDSDQQNEDVLGFEAA